MDKVAELAHRTPSEVRSVASVELDLNRHLHFSQEELGGLGIILLFRLKCSIDTHRRKSWRSPVDRCGMSGEDSHTRFGGLCWLDHHWHGLD